MAIMDEVSGAKRRRRRRLAVWIVVIPLSVLAWRAYDVLLGNNLAAVTTDQVYRSAQLSGSVLRQKISKHQLRSVVNLRGPSTHEQWYLDEIAVCQETNTKHYDIPMSATVAPDEATIRTLIRTLRTAPKPVLIHCKNGADRTGLACAFWLVVSGETNPAQAARRGLTIWHGHMPIGPTTAMDQLFNSYVQSNPGIHGQATK